MAFLTSFRQPFEAKRKSLFNKAKWFIEGLLAAPRKNMQAIAHSLQKSDEQALHHFLSNSVWDWSILFDQVAKHFYNLIQQQHQDNDLCLIIDESSFVKKGRHSAGVSRQYCGTVGKTENCQVGVFAALCCDSLVSLVRSALYLPREWTKNQKRMDKAGIPSEHRRYKTKIEMARELIFHVKDNLKIPFKWVVFDAFYGRDLSLLAELDRNNITFMAHIPQTMKVFLNDFDLKIPPRKSNRGRAPQKLKPTGSDIGVVDYCKSLKGTDWKKTDVRNASKGILKAWYHRVPVWVLEKDSMTKYKYTLLIRKDLNGEISFHLTNSTDDLPRLAYMQGQRFFIEHAFRDGKQELGMDQYQVRSWGAWHKHMALNALAYLFIQTEKVAADKKQITVSTQDMVKILDTLLIPPKKLKTIIDRIIVKKRPLFPKIRNMTK